MENMVMLIVGAIVFMLFMVGCIFMIKKENELHRERLRFKNSRIRKINTSDFNGFNIDSSIIRLRARKRMSSRLDKLSELEEMNCEYSGLPSPKAYSKKMIINQ